MNVATGPWSDQEINTTVDIYFQMLTLELAEESYVKAEYQREIARTVDRSIGSIGKKLSNISAVLDEINAVWIPGYKPLSNLQGRLREVVVDRFTGDAELRAFMLRSVRGSEHRAESDLVSRLIRRPWAGRNARGIGPAWLASTSRRSSR